MSRQVLSGKEIREALCAATGTPADQLVVISAIGSFGTQKGTVIAHTYATKDGMKLEKKYLLIRDGLAQKGEKKAAEKKAPAAKK